MNLKTRIQLSVMMFLLFSVWGAWYGQMSKYLFTQLHATGDQVGNAYTAFSLAMLVAPFFIGLIADRYFAAQKVLGVLNLAGAAILFFLIQEKDPDQFFWQILAYCLTFAPAMSLTSSIAMQHMKNPEKEFPGIRVLGTVAWIVITNIVGYYKIGDQVTIFQIAMYIALFFGLFSFTLPNTPPKANANASVAQILGVDAFKLLKDRSFAIFFLSSILICIPLAFYYQNANPFLAEIGVTNPTAKMAIGQVSEVLFMLLLPLFIHRFGIKIALLMGMLAWALRYVLFAYGNNSDLAFMLFTGIALHGICYDFFFVSGQIYTDAKTPERFRSSAQGLITLATYGFGMLIGFWVAGHVSDYYATPAGHQWQSIWLFPAFFSVGVVLVFLFAFRDARAVEPNSANI